MASLTKEEGKTGVLSYGLYRMYKKHFKGIDRKCEANVPYVKWLRICKKFNHLKMQSILQGVVFKMPFRMGSIGIAEEKMKIKFDENGELIKRNLSVDWNTTMILWRKMYPEVKTRSGYKEIRGKPICYYTNEHTDGRVFQFRWKKKYSNIKNKSVYCFDIGKQFRHDLRDMTFKNPNIQFCTKF